MFYSIAPESLPSTIAGTYSPRPQPASLRPTNTLALCKQALAERDAPVVRYVARTRVERKAQRVEPIPPQAHSAPTLIIRPLWIIWSARLPTPSPLDGLRPIPVIPPLLKGLTVPDRPGVSLVVGPNSPAALAQSNARWEESRRLGGLLASVGIFLEQGTIKGGVYETQGIRYSLWRLGNGRDALCVQRRKPSQPHKLSQGVIVTSAAELKEWMAESAASELISSVKVATTGGL